MKGRSFTDTVQSVPNHSRISAAPGAAGEASLCTCPGRKVRLGSRKRPSVFSRLSLECLRTRSHLSACAEAETTKFASKGEGKKPPQKQHHKQTSKGKRKKKKDESDAALPAAAVRGRGRALPALPTEKAAGPPQPALAAQLRPARNSPRFGS